MPSMSAPPLNSSSRDEQAAFSQALAALRSSAGEADLLRRVDEIAETTTRLFAERTGMADELLCVYEQLGIVFELTRKLTRVNEESEAVHAFLESLRMSFRGCQVFFASPRRNRGWMLLGTDMTVEPWLVAGVQRARERGGTIVDVFPAGQAQQPITEVMFGPVNAGDSFVGAIVLTRRPPIREFRASDMCLLQSLTAFCGDWIRNHRLTKEVQQASIAMVRLLVNAVEQKDEYLSGHSLRVGYYSLMLGRTLGLSHHDLQMLQWSALLHDVGKIGIRDDVLKKPGRLTDDEFDHIKEHPVRSYKIVQEVPQLAEALDGVLHHHERWDGRGYPHGLAGSAIPLQARIIQIADVFDALTSSRSYRPAHDWSSALAIMSEESGRTVDPSLQKAWDGLVRSLVASNPGAWANLVARASRFGPETDSDFADPLEEARHEP